MSDHDNKKLKKQNDELRNALSFLAFWVRGSLNCKSHQWDADQREAAEFDVKEADRLLKQTDGG